MSKELDDISRQIDFVLDKLFKVGEADFLESLNYISILNNQLLRPSDPHTTQHQKAYVFVEKSWSRVNSAIREAENQHGIKNYNDLPSSLATHITEVIGTWQSLLRYHPRGDMVHRACIDLINRLDPSTLNRFVWFLERVNTRGEEFIDPQVIKMAKAKLTKH